MATAFFANNAVQANWVTRIPAVQEELTLSAGALGTALLGLPVGLTAIVLVTTLCASSLQPMKPQRSH